MVGHRTSDEKSVSADSSPSRIGDRSVRSSTGEDSLVAGIRWSSSDLNRDPICNFAAGGAGLDISYPGW